MQNMNKLHLMYYNILLTLKKMLFLVHNASCCDFSGVRLVHEEKWLCGVLWMDAGLFVACVVSWIKLDWNWFGVCWGPAVRRINHALELEISLRVIFKCTFNTNINWLCKSICKENIVSYVVFVQFYKLALVSF